MCETHVNQTPRPPAAVTVEYVSAHSLPDTPPRLREDVRPADYHFGGTPMTDGKDAQ